MPGSGLLLLCGAQDFSPIRMGLICRMIGERAMTLSAPMWLKLRSKMSASVLADVIQKSWKPWPALDQKGYLNEGLQEVATYLVTLLVGDREDASIKEALQALAKEFEQMTAEQKNYFVNQIEKHLCDEVVQAEDLIVLCRERLDWVREALGLTA